MIPNRVTALVLGCTLWIGFLSGCSSSETGKGTDLFPASGVLMSGGKPLSGATVVFIPEKGPTAMGQSDAEGKFRLTSGGRAGVAAGKSKVTVTKYSTPPKDPKSLKPEDMQKMQMAGPTSQASNSLVPERYTSPETSPLEAEVVSDGKNEFEFNVD
jgi:hypothetical protein